VFDGNFSAVVLSPNVFQDPNLLSTSKILAASFMWPTPSRIPRRPSRYRAVPGAGLGNVDFLIPSAICSSGWFWRDPSTLPGDSRLRPPASGISRMTCSWEISVMARSKINVFHPTTGSYLGTLNDLLGTSIVVPNLWALQSGNGGSGGYSSVIYFTAGISGSRWGPAWPFRPVAGRSADWHQLGAEWVELPARRHCPEYVGHYSIQGVNLASTTRTWDGGDFVNGAVPTEIDGVTAGLMGSRSLSSS